VGEQHLRRVQGGVNTHVYYRCHHRQKPECGQPPVAEHLLDEQIYAELRRAAIPISVLAWVSRRIDALVAKEGDLQAGARQRLDETIAAIARQERVLLNHRLQEHVTEEEFIARKQELAERRVALEGDGRTAPPTNEDLGKRAKTALFFTAHAAEGFSTGSAVRRRAILHAIGSNYEVTDKTVRFSAKKLLSLVSSHTALALWGALAQDLLKLCGDTSEYLAIPNLDVDESEERAQPQIIRAFPEATSAPSRPARMRASVPQRTTGACPDSTRDAQAPGGTAQ
jgi:hypothetical protein